MMTSIDLPATSSHRGDQSMIVGPHQPGTSAPVRRVVGVEEGSGGAFGRCAV
jgi:hypothetical protein